MTNSNLIPCPHSKIEWRRGKAINAKLVGMWFDAKKYPAPLGLPLLIALKSGCIMAVEIEDTGYLSPLGFHNSDWWEHDIASGISEIEFWGYAPESPTKNT